MSHKWLAFITVFVLACSACGAQQRPDDVPTMSDPAVVKLVMIEDGDDAGYCTAWKLSEGFVMTAGHCCEDAKTVTYTARGQHAVPGAEFKVVFDNDNHDVCVMSGKVLGAPIRLARMDPPIGQAVWTAGFPRTEFLISSGYWSGRTEEGMAKASVAVFGGASGSPVMNSDGEAVGVLVAFYPPMSNLALLTPIEWMRDAEKSAH